MSVPPGLNELERAPEGLTEARSIVPHDGKAAASFRSVERKGGNDCVPSDFQGPSETRDIRSTVTLLGQEMKGRPIVPNIVSLRRLPGCCIRDDPMNLCGAAPKAGFRGLECGPGQIEDGYILKAPIDEIVGQA